MTTQRQFKPLLAATMKDENLIRFPVIGSPKIDGVRVLIHPELGPVTRSLKPLPNRYVRQYLDKPKFAGLDGEIISKAKGGTLFNSTQSDIMRHDGTPEFEFHVFDSFLNPEDRYSLRLAHAKERVELVADPRVILHTYKELTDYSQVMDYEIESLDAGFEGLMLRSPDGPYKFGRSSEREGILVKVKQFEDAEATVIGFEYLQENNNEAFKNELGRTARSTFKSGMYENTDMLGSLTVEGIDAFDGVVFSIGSGFDHAMRKQLAREGGNLIGLTVTYTYQDHGSLQAPRFPIFKGFREAE